MIAGIHTSQEIFVIDVLTAFRKHVLRLLRLYGDKVSEFLLSVRAYDICSVCFETNRKYSLLIRRMQSLAFSRSLLTMLLAKVLEFCFKTLEGFLLKCYQSLLFKQEAVEALLSICMLKLQQEIVS